MERESLERKIGEELKPNFKLDLIVEEEVGYSVLWISQKAAFLLSLINKSSIDPKTL